MDPLKFHIEAEVTISPILPPQPPILPYGLHLLPQGVVPTIVELDALQWVGVHDDATSGTAAGTTAYPVTIGGKQARSFPNAFTNNGGMRYHIEFAKNIPASIKNWIYAGDLYVDNPAMLGQMELDMNWVDAAQKTYIFGQQANTNSKAWDITRQDSAGCHWVPTAVKTDPRAWPAATWCHFEHKYHRDDAGNITYDEIYWGGVKSEVGVTLASARVLNPAWEALVALVNWQVGGFGTGSVTVYGSNLVTARW